MMENTVDLSWVLNHDERFRYQLLSRMQADCDYYLSNRQITEKHFWAGNAEKQIMYMKALWDSFSPENKPEWLPYDQILDYEKRIAARISPSERNGQL